MVNLFLRGWMQVFLVSIQTWFLAQRFYLGVLIVGFLISLVWTLNVKSVALGGWPPRLVYSCGAALGAVSGLGAGNLILA